MGISLEEAIGKTDVYRSEGHSKEDTVAFIKGLAEQVRLSYGDESGEYVSMLNELGGYERGCGMLEGSADAFLKAAEIQMENPPAASSNRNCGCTKCPTVDIQETAVPDPELATTLCNLGGTYRLMGGYEQSEYAFQMAIQLYGASLGPRHPLYAAAVNNLALLRQDQKRYDDAIMLHDRAHEILGTMGDPVYRGTNLFNRALCECLRKGDLKRAQEDIAEAVRLYEANGVGASMLGHAKEVQELIEKELEGWETRQPGVRSQERPCTQGQD